MGAAVAQRVDDRFEACVDLLVRFVDEIAIAVVATSFDDVDPRLFERSCDADVALLEARRIVFVDGAFVPE